MSIREDKLKAYIDTWEDSGELSPTQFDRFVKLAKEELQATWRVTDSLDYADLDDLPEEVSEAYRSYLNNRHVEE